MKELEMVVKQLLTKCSELIDNDESNKNFSRYNNPHTGKYWKLKHIKSLLMATSALVDSLAQIEDSQ